MNYQLTLGLDLTSIVDNSKPNIIKTLDIKTESLVGFEIFLDNLKLPKKPLKTLLYTNLHQVKKNLKKFIFIVKAF